MNDGIFGGVTSDTDVETPYSRIETIGGKEAQVLDAFFHYFDKEGEVQDAPGEDTAMAMAFFPGHQMGRVNNGDGSYSHRLYPIAKSDRPTGRFGNRRPAQPQGSQDDEGSQQNRGLAKETWAIGSYVYITRLELPALGYFEYSFNYALVGNQTETLDGVECFRAQAPNFPRSHERVMTTLVMKGLGHTIGHWLPEAEIICPSVDQLEAVRRQVEAIRVPATSGGFIAPLGRIVIEQGAVSPTAAIQVIKNGEVLVVKSKAGVGRQTGTGMAGAAVAATLLSGGAAAIDGLMDELAGQG